MNEQLTFRKATMKDAKILFDWRNDPMARENSISTQKVIWEEHADWLSKKLKDSQSQIFILLKNNVQPVGQVRFDIFDKVGTVSISVASSLRGLGYGKEGLKILSEYVLSLKIAKILKAYIKKTNTASLGIFLYAGFSVSEVEFIQGEEFVICLRYNDKE